MNYDANLVAFGMLTIGAIVYLAQRVFAWLRDSLTFGIRPDDRFSLTDKGHMLLTKTDLDRRIRKDG